MVVATGATLASQPAIQSSQSTGRLHWLLPLVIFEFLLAIFLLSLVRSLSSALSLSLSLPCFHVAPLNRFLPALSPAFVSHTKEKERARDRWKEGE